MAGKPINVDELRKGGLVKLKGKDNFSMWVKSSCCSMNGQQLRKLADIADRYGKGFLLFSSRQIPILTHINLADAETVKKELETVLLELDRCGPRVRNVNVCYEDKLCPDAVTNSISLGEKLDNFFRDPILHKVKLGVSGCEKDCVCCRVLTDIGFVGVARDSGGDYYDVYVGGKLGVNPYVGRRIAERLPEDEAVSLVQNYFDLLRTSGKPGERAAEVVHRLGFEHVRQALNKDVARRTALKPVTCPSRLKAGNPDESIVRIRATCGEVTSAQVRKIADVADRYGKGFVHFAVRGGPEIPCVNKKDIAAVRKELQSVGMDFLEPGIDNMQSCFGNYCDEGLADPQGLLRRIEKKVVELGLNNTAIRISASGCPNSCGIAHLNDIGFHGVMDPEVVAANCSGCGLCATLCKRKAIEVRDGVAVIDKSKCAFCGSCVSTCPMDGIISKRQGFAALVGGKGEGDARLGEVIGTFLSEDEALRLAEGTLRLVKEKNAGVAEIIDQIGLESFKQQLHAPSRK